MGIRLGVATLVGILIAGSLLVLMQVLIATGHSAISEEGTGYMVDFVRVKREETLQTKKTKPKKPPTPDQPPPDMPQPQMENVDAGVETIGVSPVAVSADVSIGGFGLVASDGDYLPIVKVAPIYPRRALSRGLEGYVIVEFTVTTAGTVKDVTVVESTSSLFERAAVNAALKFKYKPRVVDGNPIEVQGVRNKITFQIES